MTELEQRAITALHHVKMPSKTWHADRAEALNARMLLFPDRPLAVDQKADLWFLVWRYRRQVDDPVLFRAANEMVNGALSLEF